MTELQADIDDEAAPAASKPPTLPAASDATPPPAPDAKFLACLERIPAAILLIVEVLCPAQVAALAAEGRKVDPAAVLREFLDRFTTVAWKASRGSEKWPTVTQGTRRSARQARASSDQGEAGDGNAAEGRRSQRAPIVDDDDDDDDGEDAAPVADPLFTKTLVAAVESLRQHVATVATASYTRKWIPGKQQEWRIRLSNNMLGTVMFFVWWFDALLNHVSFRTVARTGTLSSACALEQCVTDADKLDEKSFRSKYAEYDLWLRPPTRTEMSALRLPSDNSATAAPSAVTLLTWDEQRTLFKRRVALALNRVATTFGRFVVLEGVLYDGYTLLVAGKRAPEAVGRTQAELEADLEAAWVAGGCKSLDLAAALALPDHPGREIPSGLPRPAVCCEVCTILWSSRVWGAGGQWGARAGHWASQHLCWWRLNQSTPW